MQYRYVVKFMFSKKATKMTKVASKIFNRTQISLTIMSSLIHIYFIITYLILILMLHCGLSINKSVTTNEYTHSFVKMNTPAEKSINEIQFQGRWGAKMIL